MSKTINSATNEELLAEMGRLLSIVDTAADPAVRTVARLELFGLTLEKERRETLAEAKR